MRVASKILALFGPPVGTGCGKARLIAGEDQRETFVKRLLEVAQVTDDLDRRPRRASGPTRENDHGRGAEARGHLRRRGGETGEPLGAGAATPVRDTITEAHRPTTISARWVAPM